MQHDADGHAMLEFRSTSLSQSAAKARQLTRFRRHSYGIRSLSESLPKLPDFPQATLNRVLSRWSKANLKTRPPGQPHVVRGSEGEGRPLGTALMCASLEVEPSNL